MKFIKIDNDGNVSKFCYGSEDCLTILEMSTGIDGTIALPADIKVLSASDIIVLDSVDGNFNRVCWDSNAATLITKTDGITNRERKESQLLSLDTLAYDSTRRTEIEALTDEELDSQLGAY